MSVNRTEERVLLEAVLRDGTPLEDLFDFRRRQISARVFWDPEIHRLEMERIFGRCWLFVGLESEIPNVGDYVTRTLGADSVIVARGGGGEITIVLNRCTHRGVQLCVSDSGNVDHFRCPYHGWLFEPGGELFGMPFERDWLGPDGDRGKFAIRRARVETRGGLIFGTWDDQLPDLETYLGDFCFYFDMVFCSVDANLVATGPPQRWSLPFNWKLGAENFAGDGYHTSTAHRSVVDIGLLAADPRTLGVITTTCVDPRWGHGFLAPPALLPGQDLPALDYVLPWLPPEVLPQLEQHLSPEQLDLVRVGAVPLVTTIFPNFSWLASPVFFFIRTWQPIGPGEIELRTWTLTHPDATAEQRRMRDQISNFTFGFTGMLEQDDMAIWSRIQRAYEGVVGGQEMINYTCTRPVDKSHFLPDGRDWPGPGEIRRGFPGDDPLWNFHLRWLHLMRAGQP